MVRALLRGMKRLGLRLPEMAGKFTQATVPLDLKRAVVQTAVEQAGLAVLPPPRKPLPLAWACAKTKRT